MEKEISFDKFRYAHMRSDNPQKEDFIRHMHNLYEIMFIVDGSHEYVVDNKKFIFKPMDLLIVPPKKFHFINITSNSPYERHVLNFSEDELPQPLLDKVFKKSRQFSLTKDSEICRIFRSFDDYSDRFEIQERMAVAKCLLLELLINISDLKEQDKKEHIYYDTFLSKILKYIDEHLNDIENADQIAANLFVSKSYLFFYFKKAIGIPIMQFVNNKRIMHAQTLLKTGELPTKVYSKCGFKDYTTFYRSCYKYIGVPPSKIHSDT